MCGREREIQSGLKEQSTKEELEEREKERQKKGRGEEDQKHSVEYER